MADQPHAKPLAEDERFLLGEISATIKALPSRMDRFESQMTSTLSGLANRVTTLENQQSRESGARGTIRAVAAMAWTLVGATVSGVGTYLLGKH